jgi:hypothetical protein
VSNNNNNNNNNNIKAAAYSIQKNFVFEIGGLQDGKDICFYFVIMKSYSLVGGYQRGTIYLTLFQA